jgi:CAAX prenyl protease-like protein
VSEQIILAPVVLWTRILRAVVLVPIIEELFWRAWLMRWLISPRFEQIKLGAYAPMAFWVTAILFASEHGPYWDVGLITGVIYNWWMVRTRSLGDCILVHAVTNACLCGYVVATKHWEYWL